MRRGRRPASADGLGAARRGWCRSSSQPKLRSPPCFLSRSWLSRKDNIYVTPDPDWVGCYGDIQTASVGSLEPNAFGLHDGLGNDWEWTEGCRRDAFHWIGADTAPSPEDCASRETGGGSWHLVGGHQRGLFLSGSKVGSRDYAVGFGVIRAITDRGGLDIAVTDDGHTQLLFEAISDDSPRLVAAVLDAGANLNAHSDVDGWTHPVRRCEFGQRSIAEFDGRFAQRRSRDALYFATSGCDSYDDSHAENTADSDDGLLLRGLTLPARQLWPELARRV